MDDNEKQILWNTLIRLLANQAHIMMALKILDNNAIPDTLNNQEELIGQLKKLIANTPYDYPSN